MNDSSKSHGIRQSPERPHSGCGSLGRKTRLPKPRRTCEGSSSLPTRTTPSPRAEAPKQMNTAQALAQFLGALERQGAIIITPEFRALLFRDTQRKEAA